jgi:hypothetical protein
MSSTNINVASREWMNRPDDQRYTSLAELKAAVLQRKHESWTATPDVKTLRMIAGSDGGAESLAVELYDPTAAARRSINPTNFAFGQLSQYAKAPASYLRTLPAQLAAINLQWGLEHSSLRDDALVLAQSNGSHTLRAMTSTSYGRIWDHQVVEAVEKVNTDGRWQIPSASYATKNPKRATTLYASDRDVFLFLVDPKHPIEVPGEPDPMFRGFYVWNSEVGSAVFGLCSFLYRYVCDNRIIWGATDIRELRIRHTGGAPERFAYEGEKYLRAYSEESTIKAVAGIKAADQFEQIIDVEVEKKSGRNDGVAAWLQKRGFTKTVAKGAVDAAQAEEGEVRSLWDIVNGITAYARTIPHTDERVAVEAQAGKLMSLVTE